MKCQHFRMNNLRSHLLVETCEDPDSLHPLGQERPTGSDRSPFFLSSLPTIISLYIPLSQGLLVLRCLNSQPSREREKLTGRMLSGNI